MCARFFAISLLGIRRPRPVHKNGVARFICLWQSCIRSHASKPRQNHPCAFFLGIIPTGRPSDAYGYSQALSSTWAEYQRDVGSRFKNRDSFASAFDFIQWYMDKSYKRNGVSKWDAYAQYLNYHEGHGGYSRGSHNSKQWLLGVANKVNSRAKQYSTQLSRCQAELDKASKGWF